MKCPQCETFELAINELVISSAKEREGTVVYNRKDYDAAMEHLAEILVIAGVIDSVPGVMKIINGTNSALDILMHRQKH